MSDGRQRAGSSAPVGPTVDGTSVATVGGEPTRSQQVGSQLGSQTRIRSRANPSAAPSANRDRRSGFLISICLAACGGGSKEPPPTGSASGSSSDKLVGTFSVGGVAQELVACKPGTTPDQDHTYVVVTTPNGALRFELAQLYWSADPTGKSQGEHLSCEKLDRSYRSRNRDNGSTIWLGMLDFRCTSHAGAVTGKLELDCGNITPTERAQLEADRKAAKGSATP